MDITENFLAFIDKLKSKLKNEPISEGEVSAFALEVAKEIDRRKVYGEPTLAWERLYDEALWLKAVVAK